MLKLDANTVRQHDVGYKKVKICTWELVLYITGRKHCLTALEIDITGRTLMYSRISTLYNGKVLSDREIVTVTQ